MLSLVKFVAKWTRKSATTFTNFATIDEDSAEPFGLIELSYAHLGRTEQLPVH
jgi:hypothetical protein